MSRSVEEEIEAATLAVNEAQAALEKFRELPLDARERDGSRYLLRMAKAYSVLSRAMSAMAAQTRRGSSRGWQRTLRNAALDLHALDVVIKEWSEIDTVELSTMTANQIEAARMTVEELESRAMDVFHVLGDLNEAREPKS